MVQSSQASTHNDILIVDDTPANLRLLLQVLQGAGYRVRAVTNGERALAAVRHSQPELILLDIRLPDIDGFEVCSILKTDSISHQIPIIFISALDDTNAKVNAFRAGGVDYVTKPIHPEEVLARVATHLALRQLNLQLQQANKNLAIRLNELETTNRLLGQEIVARRAAEERNAHLLAHERERVLRLDQLLNEMMIISGPLDLTSVYQAIVNGVTRVLPCVSAALARAQQANTYLEIVAVANLSPDVVGIQIPWQDPFLGRVAAEKIMLQWETSPPELQSTGETLAAPLIVGDRLEGIIVVVEATSKISFDHADFQLLRLFTQQATIAIQNTRLFEEVQHLARIDPLTGLFNRRYFYEIAQRDLERMRRSRGSLGLMLLDIDHFKQINDQYGHHAGDQALQLVADLLRQRVRTADVSARFGGEEMVVLLPDASLEQTLVVAERIRTSIATLTIESEHGSFQLTVSIGVTIVSGKQLDCELDDLIIYADQACYAAKHAGRNQIKVWNESVITIQPE
ncbi:diguanylate cyclase [Candidatus Chloroploca sp. M-50]|uniref:Diguanylate cyclase n=1 Tax=Candidatus Chloroploca mongolica TaxID=2528176 RepID=A0ABS4D8U2_9CHLR|nr:diguanylate cyclase [Candidatus Chloroploca mongolica]MBP1465867.1 diguanylate cyclase [Candidatus Chloroploca mongolica]